MSTPPSAPLSIAPLALFICLPFPWLGLSTWPSVSQYCVVDCSERQLIADSLSCAAVYGPALGRCLLCSYFATQCIILRCSYVSSCPVCALFLLGSLFFSDWLTIWPSYWSGIYICDTRLSQRLIKSVRAT